MREVENCQQKWNMYNEYKLIKLLKVNWHVELEAKKILEVQRKDGLIGEAAKSCMYCILHEMHNDQH
jgi:hypothetical protein